VHKPIDIVPLRKAARQMFGVLVNPATQIGRHADIEPLRSTREDVYVKGHTAVSATNCMVLASKRFNQNPYRETA
jgi:hypothetical protein